MSYLNNSGSGSAGSSVAVNGSVIASANFNGTTPAASSNSTNVTFQVDGSGNVSAEVPFTISPTTAQITIAGSSLTNLYAMQGLNRETFGDGTFGPFIVYNSAAGQSVAFFDTGSGTQWRVGGGGDLQSVQGATLKWFSPATVGISPISSTSLAIGNGTGSDFSGNLKLTGISIQGALTDGSASVGTSGQVLSSTVTGVKWVAASSGSGTVTSVSSGNIDAIATVSVATPTTTPAISFALATQSANTVWAGPTTGAAANPTFRLLVSADIPNNAANTTGTASNLSGTPALPNGTTATTQSLGDNSTKIATDAFVLANSITNPMTTAGDIIYENATPAIARLPIGTIGQVLTVVAGLPAWATSSASVLWSGIGNAGANLTLANANFTTTFNQTSSIAWLWANTTTATVSTTNASPLLELAANYWTGAASAQDLWTLGISALTAGSNSPSTLTFTHTGSTGVATVQVPQLLTILDGSATQTVLDQGNTIPGISNISVYGAGSKYTPGYFWYTSDNNPTKPKAGIYMQATSNGAQLLLGVSGAYATGITQHVIIRPNGGIALGGPPNIEGLLQLYGDLTSATDNADIAPLRIDMSTLNKYTGIDFGTNDSNPTKATARIAATKGSSGSSIWFGVSNSYATGITSTPLIVNYDGAVQFGAQDTSISRLAASSLAFGNGTASDTTANLSFNKVIKYAGVATTRGGVPVQVATVALTAQTAAITTTTLYAVPATGGGLYRISFYAKITTAASVSSVLGGTNGFQLTWTDPTDTTTPTTSIADALGNALNGNTTTTADAGSVVIEAKASTNIQYAYDYTSAGTAMAYKMSISVEFLG